MRPISAFLACLAVATRAFAQDGVAVEAGTALGLTWTHAGRASLTSVGIPGGGSFLGLATFYVTILPVPKLMLEPQLHLTTISSNGYTNWALSCIGQIGYLAYPDQRSSPYIAAHGGVFHRTSGSSPGAFGGSAGYRWKIGRGGALRFEILYRHWMQTYQSEQFAFTLGVGGILSH